MRMRKTLTVLHTSTSFGKTNYSFLHQFRPPPTVPNPHKSRIRPPTPAPKFRHRVPVRITVQQPSERILPQREEPLGHRFQMPNPLALRPKHLRPLPLKFLGQVPPHVLIANPHAHQVPLLLPPLALTYRRAVDLVDELIPPMQHCQVIHEVQIARPRRDLQLHCPRRRLKDIKRFALLACERREM